MDLEEITPPAADAALGVVSLADMKKHLRIVHDALDDQVTDAVRDAVAFFDGPFGVLNRMVLTRTMGLWLPGFPNGTLRLPYGPIGSVSAIDYVDDAGDVVTVDPSVYRVEAASDGKVTIALEDGETWPETSVSRGRAARISYTAGFSAGGYPDLLKRGVKLLAAHYMRNTDATLSSNRETRANHAIQFGLDQIILSLRIPLPYGEA